MTSNLSLLSALLCLPIAGCAVGTTDRVAWTQAAALPAADTASTPQQPSSPNSEGRPNTPWEVTLAGGGTNDEHFDVGNGQLTAGVGYYFNEVFELAVRQSLSYSDDESGVAGVDDDDIWNFQTRVAFDFHLPLGVFVPYVGANIGYLYGDSPVSRDTMAAGPEAGVKIYLQRAAFLQLGVEYEYFFETEENLSDAFESGQVYYFAGFGLRF